MPPALLALIELASDTKAAGVPFDLIPEGTSVAAVIVVVVLFLRRSAAWETQVQETVRSAHVGHEEARKSFEAALDRNGALHRESIALIVAAQQRTDSMMADRLAELTSAQVRLEGQLDHLAGRIAASTRPDG